ncbi:hypothetical protein EYF80_003441 [Liparis tanakae]|uniref:Uncharacterized protein n=1 Tax=Liparis tanakae TaxID=230148 RepID=A0A4Z2J829_9TELE|nr:hypothetical protein EYF80_003441 [Liparis tanakae]
MIDASHRKSRLCCSVKPAFKVLMATWISLFPGSLSGPLHTSPNSPEEKRRSLTVAFTFQLTLIFEAVGQVDILRLSQHSSTGSEPLMTTVSYRMITSGFRGFTPSNNVLCLEHVFAITPLK